MGKGIDAERHLSAIPSVHRLLQHPKLNTARSTYGHELVVAALREVLAQQRARLRPSTNGKAPVEDLIDVALRRLESFAQPSLRRVFNLTGTVLHTNLGRALLPAQAADAAMQALLAPSNLEYDLDEGERGERDLHVEGLLCGLTGAEAATVVNNNAAALLLILNTLAAGKEVPVSRGELIEIGGSFRIPEVIEGAGCRLKEVGTTNRTHLRDYARAISTNTAALLKVHASNYAIVGFVAAPTARELAALAHERGLPFIADLGSGSLLNLEAWGLPAERTPTDALGDGADLVCFSGDKLLGGPQAGLIVGRRKLVDRLQRNPLKRALRLDKARIAALESVLRLYLDPERLRESLPTLRLLTRPLDEINETAVRMQPYVQTYCGAAAIVDVAACASQIGSGALPVDLLPSAAVRVRWASRKGSGSGLSRIARSLRGLPIPVIGRIQEDALWLDVRCLEGTAQESAFSDQLREHRLGA